jgi:DNA modification methylase
MAYRAPTPPGLKRKDLVGVPWRVAFALQADGWFLRSDIVWSKPNPQPESVKDRPSRSHEYIFLFSKSEHYFYSGGQVEEQAVEPGAMRRQRTVWTVPTVPLREAHFAVFPPRLIEPCIRASTRPGQFVLDPFIGSGTVGLVASNEGRKFVGIELNKAYARIARRRVAK